MRRAGDGQAGTLAPEAAALLRRLWAGNDTLAVYGPLQEAYRLTLAAQAATATILAGGAVLAKPAAARAAQDESVGADEAAWGLGSPEPAV